MKILFRQKKDAVFPKALSSVISNCYFKELFGDSDRKIINIRAHHHTDFEIHVIFGGYQIYECADEVIRLEKGDFIIFPPHIRHKSVENSENMHKFSFTFKSEYFECDHMLHGKTTDYINQRLEFVAKESLCPKVFSESLCINGIIETTLLLFRICGFKEQPQKKADEAFDERLALAKKYISDNLEQPLAVSEVSNYCYLSSKQLTRLFISGEGMSPAKYITRERMKKICELILEEDITFKEISAKFGYASECYFSTAFKKHTGVSPGLYKKMHQKTSS